MLKNLSADNIYIVCGHTDMRKSIDGLAAIIQQQYQLDLFNNSAYRPVLLRFFYNIFKIHISLLNYYLYSDIIGAYKIISRYRLKGCNNNESIYKIIYSHIIYFNNVYIRKYERIYLGE